MKQILSHASARLWLVLVAAILAVAAIVWQSLSSPNAATAQPPVRPQVNVIYLPDPVAPVLAADQARASGIRIVSSPAELVSVAPMAHAIIVDRGMLGSVGHHWLATQLQEGRLIVGLNVPFKQLEQIPGYRAPRTPAGYLEDYSGRIFYSWLWQWEKDGVRYQVTGSDGVGSQEDLIGRITFQTRAVREHMANPPAGPTAPAVPTRPAR